LRWEIEPGIILSRDGASWIREPEPDYVALPLYEGRMIGQFDFSQKGWVSGKGRGAVWIDLPWEAKRMEPQYMMSHRKCSAHTVLGLKLPLMNISSATNARTVIAAIARDFPCNHSLNPLRASRPFDLLRLVTLLNSFAFDYGVRTRLGGLNLSFFVLDEVAAVRPGFLRHSSIDAYSASLSLFHRYFASEWTLVASLHPLSCLSRPWRSVWALTGHERLRMCSALDSIVAEIYGLSWDDMAWILHNCDHPTEVVQDKAFYRTLDPKGFWRVDKDKDPELRHTVLTLAAFHDLKETIKACAGDCENGIKAFCNQNKGEGWMLPETLCLADLGLGHDNRACKPQPVRSRLGERFFPWQIEQSVEDSWKECALHARNLMGEVGFARLQTVLHKAKQYGEVEEKAPLAAETDTGMSHILGFQRSLFPRERAFSHDGTEDPPAARKK